MARNPSSRRIEPSLGPSKDEGDDDIRLDSEDRVTGPRGKGTAPRGATAKTPRVPQESARRKTRSGPGFFGAIRRLFYWCITLGIWGGIAVAGVIAYFAAQMPSASSWTIPDRPPNIKIVSVDGTVIANRGATGGEALALEEMSPYLPEAIVAIEDRRFYSHFGVDPIGIARAFVTNILVGQKAQGASTITQQLARNLFLSPDKTLERKVQEVLLSLWLEHKFTKEQILAMYLNRVYFGSNAYGVEAASQRYFSKSARDINLGEAATLAGLVKAPSRLSPATNPQAAQDRARVVLGAMREQGYISDSDLTRAMAQPPARAKSYWSGAGQYVADMVMDELKGLIGEVKTDVVVTTTIDADLEKAAEKSIATTLDKDGAKQNVSQGALVAIDGNGAIRALVGGRDYATSQFNRAVKAKRQPGSAFKPFVYASAMELGDTPDTIRNDAPIRIGNWTPENYEQKYNGPVTLAYGFAHSLNTIAAQLVMEAGPDQVIKLAHRLGIESELQSNASIALGTSEVSLLELTSAYAPFMNGGFKATPHVIAEIADVSGKSLYKADYGEPPRVLNQQIVQQMTLLMEGTVREGTGKAAQLKDWQVAGKTGTTQSFRDALFVGFTSNLTTGVWFGNDDGTPMKKVTGGGLPAKTFKDFMTVAHKGLTPVPLFGDQRPQEDSEPSLTSMIQQVLSGTPDNAYPPAPASPQQPSAAVPPTQTGRDILPQAQPQMQPNGALRGQYPAGGAQQPEAADPYGRAEMPPARNEPGHWQDESGYPAEDMGPPADLDETSRQPAQRQGGSTTLLDVIMGR
ncbi:transglycosylase domain-containing protein [Allorhizobium undicola]|uniref:transglycosylase domain-containing protein n=1 Tax=Allorhizobium undicola TaxID=78527 RepID=UPI000481062D|nr:transglycosylase domain-containing protein [Allorhizobium undicola]